MLRFVPAKAVDRVFIATPTSERERQRINRFISAELCIILEKFSSAASVTKLQKRMQT